MISTYRSLRGNQRASIITEPMWAIPHFLYAPFATVYMIALGLSEVRIGLISTLGLVSQFVFALLSGVITDRLGRRYTTFIFDFVAWSLPSLIYAFSRNFAWFAIGVVFNGVYRVTSTSWTCLTVEDAEPDKLVHMFMMLDIAGLISGFFAPISYLLLKRFDLVATVRGLYIFAFLSMTAKFFTLFFLSDETKMGERRMRETRGVSVFSELLDMRHVARQMLRNKGTLLTILLWIALAVSSNTSMTFFPIIATERVGVPNESLALIATLKTIITLICYFTFVPRVSARRFKRPLLLGILLAALSRAILSIVGGGAYIWYAASVIFIGGGACVWLVVSVILESAALSIILPLQNSLQALHLESHERARSMSIFQATVLIVCAPFGAISGFLSELYRPLTMMLAMLMYVIAAVITAYLSREKIAEEL